MSSQKSRRESRRSARHGEEVQRQLLSLIEALLHPDDERRQANIEAVLHVLRPVTKVHVVDALVDRLAHRSTLSTRVVSTLSRFGTAALARLTQRFQETRSVALQYSIIDALTTMVPSLDSEQRSALLEETMHLPRFAADNSIWERVGALIELLARRVEAPPRNATASTSGASYARTGDAEELPRPSAVQDCGA